MMLLVCRRGLLVPLLFLVCFFFFCCLVLKFLYSFAEFFTIDVSAYSGNDMSHTPLQLYVSTWLGSEHVA